MVIRTSRFHTVLILQSCGDSRPERTLILKRRRRDFKGEAPHRWIDNIFSSFQRFANDLFSPEAH
jgi:hypothetical protein